MNEDRPVRPPKAVLPVTPVGAENPNCGADFAGERAGSLHNARVNFHLLRFAIQLADQVVDLRDR